MAKRVAVIDIGSNSIRMVVFEKTSRFAFHLLHEAKSKVRISQNAYQNGGNLQPAAMDRTFYALSDFLTVAASFKVTKTLCVATSALRDAPNKAEFIQRVKKELHLNIKVIDGTKEAIFGAVACANLLPEQANALTIDIGGGSTEFALINQKSVSNPISLDLGTVRLKELFFDTGKIDEAVTYIDTKLDLLETLHPTTLIGIGGTFRAIANALILHTKYPLNKIHGYECGYKLFNQFIEDILAADEMKLKKLHIKTDRFDVIKPGALILQRVLKKLSSVSKLLSSGVGVREGVYLSDLLRNSQCKLPQNYNTSVRYLLDSYVVEHNYANNLNRLSKELFDLTHRHLEIDPIYRSALATAAKLSCIGTSIHFYSKNKHSYYLIQSAMEYGFTHKDIILIATLTRYAKGKFPPPAHRDRYASLLPDEKTLKALCYLLSLAVALLSHKPRNQDFGLRFNEGAINITTANKLYLAQEALAKLPKFKPLKVTIES